VRLTKTTNPTPTIDDPERGIAVHIRWLTYPTYSVDKTVDSLDAEKTSVTKLYISNTNLDFRNSSRSG
jgi:hypothetical protein